MSNGAKPCILVVDDDPDLASIISHILSRAGYETHSALSGQAALDWLKNRQPDVVLLDLMMPDINGFTILRALRAHDITRTLPVIIITAKADSATRDETTQAGANSFLTKPINSVLLLDHVQRALAAKHLVPPQA